MEVIRERDTLILLAVETTSRDNRECTKILLINVTYLVQLGALYLFSSCALRQLQLPHFLLVFSIYLWSTLPFIRLDQPV